ncbi:ALF repeat-containing protein [Streptomyces sp. NPDC048340]|uniref:ALF repeat-containing protein n=1 Tax=Streptomyces sp. NPDC048340 TaxID=3365537 RepID=UPI00371288AE
MTQYQLRHQDNRVRVARVASVGGPEVCEAARDALNAVDPKAIEAFLKTGQHEARAKDKAAEDAAEDAAKAAREAQAGSGTGTGTGTTAQPAVVTTGSGATATTSNGNVTVNGGGHTLAATGAGSDTALAAGGGRRAGRRRRSAARRAHAPRGHRRLAGNVPRGTEGVLPEGGTPSASVPAAGAVDPCPGPESGPRAPPRRRARGPYGFPPRYGRLARWGVSAHPSICRTVSLG